MSSSTAALIWPLSVRHGDSPLASKRHNSFVTRNSTPSSCSELFLHGSHLNLWPFGFFITVCVTNKTEGHEKWWSVGSYYSKVKGGESYGRLNASQKDLRRTPARHKPKDAAKMRSAKSKKLSKDSIRLPEKFEFHFTVKLHTGRVGASVRSACLNACLPVRPQGSIATTTLHHKMHPQA